MIRRNVQRIEVVIFGFDLGAVEDGEAEGAEQVFDLPLNLGHRMQATRLYAWRGNGEIEPFGIEALRQGGALEFGFAALPGFFERLLRRVDEFATLNPLISRELAHVFAELGEHAFAAEDFDTHRFQLFGSAGGLDAREGA